jgi:hypothetical protein
MRTEEEMRQRKAHLENVLRGLEEQDTPQNDAFLLIANVDCKAALRGSINFGEWVLNDKEEK